jgi:hypothetical protein
MDTPNDLDLDPGSSGGLCSTLKVVPAARRTRAPRHSGSATLPHRWSEKKAGEGVTKPLPPRALTRRTLRGVTPEPAARPHQTWWLDQSYSGALGTRPSCLDQRQRPGDAHRAPPMPAAWRLASARADARRASGRGRARAAGAAGEHARGGGHPFRKQQKKRSTRD